MALNNLKKYELGMAIFWTMLIAELSGLDQSVMTNITIKEYHYNIHSFSSSAKGKIKKKKSLQKCNKLKVFITFWNKSTKRKLSATYIKNFM